MEKTKKGQKSKLTWKKVYETCNHNRYTQVTKVFKTAKLKSNAKNFLKNYGKICLIGFVIILIVLTLTFWQSLSIMFLAVLLLLALCVFAVIYGTYEIRLEEDGVKFKVNFQQNYIPYNKLIGIYLKKKVKRILFIPISYYSLEITEYVDSEKMNIYSFPTIMLNKKEVMNFFKTFEIKVLQDVDDEEEKENKERKMFWKAIGIVIGIILVIVFIVALVLYFIN